MANKIVHIHNYIGATRDAFEESKHPRANNGQFGAGAGKSHVEHREHHLRKGNEMGRLIRSTPAENEGARNAYRAVRAAHEAAAKAHESPGHLPYSSATPEQAHEASKKAHEAEAGMKKNGHAMEGPAKTKSHEEHIGYHLAAKTHHTTDVTKFETRQKHEVSHNAHKSAAEAHHKAAVAHAAAHMGVESKEHAHEASRQAEVWSKFAGEK
jgi:hypothetical protein